MAEDQTSTVSPDYYRKQANKVWLHGSLLVLGAFITLGVGYKHAHIGWGLAISACQIFVQTYFMMHLKNERGIIFKFLVFTVFFVIALFVLTHLHESDPLHSKAIPVN